MIISIAGLLRKSWQNVVAISKVEDFPHAFQAMADFLKEEPINNFKKSKIKGIFSEIDTEIPLTLTPEAKEHYIKLSQKYRCIPSHSDSEGRELNFLYLLGQFLSKVGIRLEYSEVKDTTYELKEHLNDFYKLWGSHENMNAEGIINTYHNYSDMEIKRFLISKLKASAEFLKNLIEKGLLK